MLALVDCNNFYVSCERAFNPALMGKPVIVLSNNDGCVISRSNEAKSLGFAMGEPIFLKKDQVRRHGVILLSSNFALYGDLSQRVMAVLKTFARSYEVYSIDEMFLDLKDLPQADLAAYAQKIKQTLWQGLGLPVSIGMGPTKTLAKAANYFAKQYPLLENIFIFNDPAKIPAYLSQIPIEKIWGIGKNWAVRLKALGIEHAQDLARADLNRMGKTLNVMIRRTALELNSQACFGLETPSDRKSILVSRSFPTAIVTLKPLQEAVANFATNAAEKLRKQASVAGAVTVFIRTQRGREVSSSTQSMTIRLEKASDDTLCIVKAVMVGLKKIFQAGDAYKKAGVILSEIASGDSLQSDFFVASPREKAQKNQKNQNLMQTLDKINEKYGKRSIQLAACGITPIVFKQENLTPAYTTRWEDILVVQATNIKLIINLEKR